MPKNLKFELVVKDEQDDVVMRANCSSVERLEEEIGSFVRNYNLNRNG